MNAIQEAIATVKEWQVRDPETRFLDGHSMSGDEAWRACLRKVRTMLEQVCSKHCIAELAKSMDEMADTMHDLHDELDRFEDRGEMHDLYLLLRTMRETLTKSA
jgi:predicted RNase H-like nuclease (RuvC/YqgF family)